MEKRVDFLWWILLTEMIVYLHVIGREQLSFWFAITFVFLGGLGWRLTEIKYQLDEKLRQLNAELDEFKEQ